jgi:hypothetical protein
MGVEPGDPPAGDPPAGDPPVVPPADDLSTLFTPEMVAERKEALAATQAEETRRAALTDEERTAEDATKAEEAAKNTVPEAYDFKLPEGMEVDKELLAETEPLFKELGLTQEKAQKVIDLYAQKVMPAIVKRQADAWQDQVAAWKNEVVATKEITLDDKGQNTDGIRVINSLFNTDEAAKFRADLDKYGLGNHPGLNLMFARMAKNLKESNFEGKGVIIDKTPKTIEGMANKLYGD